MTHLDPSRQTKKIQDQPEASAQNRDQLSACDVLGDACWSDDGLAEHVLDRIWASQSGQGAPSGHKTPGISDVPKWSAKWLTKDGNTATIVLDGVAYILRITRNGKLILTK